MRQSVIITRLADRHKGLHARDFAETHELIVEAGDLDAVFIELAGTVQDIFGVGRYTISISEPFD